MLLCAVLDYVRVAAWMGRVVRGSDAGVKATNLKGSSEL